MSVSEPAIRYGVPFSRRGASPPAKCPAVLNVIAAHAGVAGDVLGFAIEMRLERCVECGPAFGVRPGEPERRPGEIDAVIDAYDLVPARREVERIGSEISVPGAIVCTAGGCFKRPVGHGQRSGWRLLHDGAASGLLLTRRCRD